MSVLSASSTTASWLSRSKSFIGGEFSRSREDFGSVMFEASMETKCLTRSGDESFQVPAEALRGRREKSVRFAFIFDELGSLDALGGGATGNVDRHGLVRSAMDHQSRNGKGGEIAAKIRFGGRPRTEAWLADLP